MSAAPAVELGNSAAYQQKLMGLLGTREPLEVLASTPDVVARLIEPHSAATLRTRPFAGKWTPLEIVGHLCDGEWLYGYRIRLILCQERPTILGMDQDDWVARQRYNEREPADLLRQFRELRQHNVGLWRRMTAADLERVGLHNERGEESLGLMLRMEAGHDLSHIDQITRYLAAILSAERVGLARHLHSDVTLAVGVSAVEGDWMKTSRRRFLQGAVAVSVGFRGLHTLLADGGVAEVSAAGFGPLRPDADGILELPAGFRYRIVSRVGERMDDGFFVPGQPDGMGAFAGPDGRTLLVRNHELDPDMLAKSPFGPQNELLDKLPAEFAYDRGGEAACIGGTTTLLYDTSAGKLERQYLSLACTKYNCAGGPTPWGTWITCEETTSRRGEKYAADHGFAFEVEPTGEIRLNRPTPLKAMGRFRREAVAVEPGSGIVYQTEDVNDGVLYRFIPNSSGKRVDFAAGGRLQALCVVDQKSLDSRNWPAEEGAPLALRIAPGTRFAVRWIDLTDVESPTDDLRLRAYAAGAVRFARTEGIWRGDGVYFFACTTGGSAMLGQIWRYRPSPHEGTVREAEAPGTLELFLEPNDATLVQNCDNLTVAPWGDLIVCEDNDNMNYIVGVTPDGRCYRLARNAVDKSEFAGSVFSPDGSTLFVNMQSTGLTLAITGPWAKA